MVVASKALAHLCSSSLIRVSTNIGTAIEEATSASSLYVLVAIAASISTRLSMSSTDEVACNVRETAKTHTSVHWLLWTLVDGPRINHSLSSNTTLSRGRRNFHGLKLKILSSSSRMLRETGFSRRAVVRAYTFIFR